MLKALQRKFYMAAGCLFTNGTHILAGLQTKEDREVLSGFGGKIEPTDLCIVDTAIRETLEELLGLSEIPYDVIHHIMVNYIPRNQFKTGDYSVFVYTFEDLEDFLRIAKGFGLQSPLYDSMPGDFSSLLFKRKALPESEVRQLAVLPLTANQALCPWLLSDLQNYLQKLS